MLGGFLGDLIVGHPDLLLRHVSRRSASEQEGIAQLTLDSDEIPVDQIPIVAKAARIWFRVLTETLAAKAKEK